MITIVLRIKANKFTISGRGSPTPRYFVTNSEDVGLGRNANEPSPYQNAILVEYPSLTGVSSKKASVILHPYVRSWGQPNHELKKGKRQNIIRLYGL